LQARKTLLLSDKWSVVGFLLARFNCPITDKWWSSVVDCDDFTNVS